MYANRLSKLPFSPLHQGHLWRLLKQCVFVRASVCVCANACLFVCVHLFVFIRVYVFVCVCVGRMFADIFYVHEMLLVCVHRAI